MAKHKIILLTHGGWGKALIASMGLLVGKTENVFDLALEPELTLAQYIEKVQAAAEPVDANTLVLTDIPGGTTSNVALRLSQQYPWKIISGVNALMLVEAIMHQEETLTADVLQKILAAGHDSQKVLEVPVPAKNGRE